MAKRVLWLQGGEGLEAVRRYRRTSKELPGIRVRVGESLNQGSGPGDGRDIQEAGLPSDCIGGVWKDS